MPARRRLDVGRRGDEVRVDLHATVGEEPAARGLGGGHRLLRRERLARDDEERLGGREAGERRREVGAVDVGDEVKRQPRVDERGERAHCHARAEVAAADADVDDVAERRRGCRCAPAHLLGKGEHLGKDAVHLGAERRRAGRRTQRGVQHGAVLGGVDRRAGEHRVALRLDAAFAREVGEKAHRRRVDEVLREIGEHLGCVERERGEALRVARERLAQVEVAAVRLVVAGERGPGGGAVAAGRDRRPGGARNGGHRRMMPRVARPFRR
jgi:hypothetical protein